MGWALVWVVGGLGPWPRPIMGLLDVRGAFIFLSL